MSASLNIPSEFGWVLLELMIIGLQCVSTGFALVPIRKVIFSKEFYEKHFPQLVKLDQAEWGYPDNGGGPLTAKLSLEDWMTFANAQRAHYNYIEGMGTIIVFMLVSGLFFVKFTVACGAAYIVGRFFYSSGYRNKGSRGRFLGVALIDLSLFLLLISGCYGAFEFGGGLQGFKSLVGF